VINIVGHEQHYNTTAGHENKLRVELMSDCDEDIGVMHGFALSILLRTKRSNI